MKNKKKAFTLVELLVVISIIALLLSILIPSLSLAREKAKRVLCSNQTRQLGLGLTMYAGENNAKLPMDSKAAAYIYLWDVATPVVDAIAKSTGAKDPNSLKELFYCPASPPKILTEKLKESYWAPRTGGSYNYRVVGYFFLLKRPPGMGTITLTSDPCTILIDRLNIPRASQRELITDMVLCQSTRLGDFYDYVEQVQNQPMPTNHIRRGQPLGGNIFFVDQHMKWRNFNEMNVRAFGATKNIKMLF